MDTSLILFDVQATIEAVKQRIAIIDTLRKEVLREGIDFGTIPGVDKPTLFKPGAERLCMAFGFTNVFVDGGSVEDFDKGFFHYRYVCGLIHIASGKVVATGIGSCNSMESKYRWRNANRTCPECGQPVFKSKFKEEFYCNANKGGCGATFNLNDTRITGQEVGKIENDDPYSLVNTIDKMAQKRALVAAVLIGTGASEYFTQDVEDYIDAEFSQVEPPKPAKPAQAAQPKAAPKSNGNGNGHRQITPLPLPEWQEPHKPAELKALLNEQAEASKALKATKEDLTVFGKRFKEHASHAVKGVDLNTVGKAFVRWLFDVDSSEELSGGQFRALTDWMTKTNDRQLEAEIVGVWNELQAIAEATAEPKAVEPAAQTG